jgi:hypothetical protein
VSRHARRLAVAVALLGALCRTAAADWASDEAYIKRLGQHLKDLQRIADLFLQERRSLELVEFKFAGLQLPLADPDASPEQIVRRVLQKSFPQVNVTMKRLQTQSPPDVEIWKWRCTLVGAVEEIRWATQLLLRKGLFVRPGRDEPVTLELEPSQQRGKLAFIGHHIRLKQVPVPRLPEMPSGPDLLSSRTDPLTQEIRRLRGELAGLRRRVQDILSFEARVEAMRHVIKQLRALTQDGRDPFRAFTPLLDLELVRYEKLTHSGEEIAIVADAPSESARTAAERWFGKQRKRKLRYRVAALGPIYVGPVSKQLSVPGDAGAGGTLCALKLSGARPLDLGLAAAAHAVVSVGPERVEVSGVVERAPLRRALEAAAATAQIAMLWDGDSLLFVPRKAAAEAKRLLAEGARGGGKPVALRQPAAPVGEALSLLQRFSGEAITAPASLSGAAGLVGRAGIGSWLRLLGAALGLRVTRDSGWQLRPAGGREVALVAPKAAGRGARATARELAPLALVRPRLLLTCGAKPRAIVAASGGAPLWVKRGMRLGRGRNTVTRVDERGVTVRWSDAGLTAMVLLPFGELDEPRAGGR